MLVKDPADRLGSGEKDGNDIMVGDSCLHVCMRLAFAWCRGHILTPLFLLTLCRTKRVVQSSLPCLHGWVNCPQYSRPACSLPPMQLRRVQVQPAPDAASPRAASPRCSLPPMQLPPRAASPRCSLPPMQLPPRAASPRSGVACSRACPLCCLPACSLLQYSLGPGAACPQHSHPHLTTAWSSRLRRFEPSPLPPETVAKVQVPLARTSESSRV
jgi:hypothetical protein